MIPKPQTQKNWTLILGPLGPTRGSVRSLSPARSLSTALSLSIALVLALILSFSVALALSATPLQATEPEHSGPICQHFFIQPSSRVIIPFTGEEVQSHGEVPPYYWFRYYNQARQNLTEQYGVLYSFRISQARNSPIYVALVDESSRHHDHRLQGRGPFCMVTWGPEPAEWD